jgi:acyl dehydratase
MSEPIPATPRTLDDLRALSGVSLGPTDWVVVDQEMITAFASVTRDPQKLHLDDEAAQTAGFPRPIAHGYLVLSLIGGWGPELVTWPAPVINYGLNRLRFIAPVVAGDSVRAKATITDITERNDWWIVTQKYEVESRDTGQLALIAETLIATSGWERS